MMKLIHSKVSVFLSTSFEINKFFSVTQSNPFPFWYAVLFSSDKRSCISFKGVQTLFQRGPNPLSKRSKPSLKEVQTLFQRGPNPLSKWSKPSLKSGTSHLRCGPFSLSPSHNLSQPLTSGYTGRTSNLFVNNPSLIY